MKKCLTWDQWKIGKMTNKILETRPLIETKWCMYNHLMVP